MSKRPCRKLPPAFTAKVGLIAVRGDKPSPSWPSNLLSIPTRSFNGRPTPRRSCRRVRSRRSLPCRLRSEALPRLYDAVRYPPIIVRPIKPNGSQMEAGQAAEPGWCYEEESDQAVW
jgi:hypothetical protein